MPANTLYDLQRAYLEMAPIDAEVIPLLRNLPGYPAIDAQEMFCRQVVNSAYAHFPPSKRWMKTLLKRIEKDIADVELSDDLAELFLTSMTSQQYADDAEFCDEAFITFLPVKETDESGGKSTLTTTLRVLRLHNDVGTRIWEAGLYLAEILYGCPTLIARKAVIELGAGSGVTSLLTIKNCCSKDRERYLPRRAVITDNMPEVIKNLKYNVALNATAEWTEELPMDSSLTDRSYVYSGTDVASDATPPGTMSASKCVVSTQHLDFNTATEEQCRQLRPDVILVADCTYSEDMHLPLLTVIEKLLCIPTSTSAHPHQHASSSSSTSSSSSSSKSSNLTEELLADAADRGQAVCLLAGTIRHPLTYAHFIDTLTANANLQWHDVTSWAQTVAGEQRYRYDYRDSIRVLLITAKII